MSAGEVDDTQSRVAKSDARFHVHAAIVRSAVLQDRGHRPQTIEVGRPAIRRHDASNAAHNPDRLSKAVAMAPLVSQRLIVTIVLVSLYLLALPFVFAERDDILD